MLPPMLERFLTRLFCVPLLFAVIIPTHVAALEPLELRVVAWNIEWFPGLSPEASAEEQATHFDAVRAEVARLKPDLLLASEIRDWQAFAELTDVLPALRPVAVSAFRSKYGPGFWPQQLAIATTLPVQASWSEPFRFTYVRQVRGFSAAVLKVPGTSDQVILAYSLHLKSNRARSPGDAETNYRMREDAVIQLLTHINEMERLVFPNSIRGIIVGGDFNTNHDGQFGDRTIEIMERAGFHNTWRGVPREDRLTWRGSDRFEPTTLDYIFTKGFGQPRAVLLKVDDSTSDHWPVGLVLRIR